jgi:hypothetical protein
MKHNATNVSVGMVVSVHTSRATARFRADRGMRRDKHSMRTSMHVACHACKRKCMHECMDKHIGSGDGYLHVQMHMYKYAHTHTKQNTTKQNMYTSTQAHRNTHMYTTTSQTFRIGSSLIGRHVFMHTHIHIHSHTHQIGPITTILSIQREACNSD